MGRSPRLKGPRVGVGFLRGGSLPARGCGERCKFCEWGPGHSPGHWQLFLHSRGARWPLLVKFEGMARLAPLNPPMASCLNYSGSLSTSWPCSVSCCCCCGLLSGRNLTTVSSGPQTTIETKWKLKFWSSTLKKLSFCHKPGVYFVVTSAVFEMMHVLLCCILCVRRIWSSAAL